MALKYFFSSFKLKIALGVVFVQLITTAAALYVSVNFLETYGEREILLHANTAVKLLATSAKDAVLVNDYALLDALTKTLADNKEVLYARVKNELGEVIAQNGDAKTAENAFQPDYSVREVRDGSFDTFSEMNSNDYYIGRVEIGISTESYKKFISSTLDDLMILTLIQMCSTLVFAYLIAHLLTRQINRIAYASTRIMAGELGITIPSEGNDDIARVSRTFNAMSIKVKSNHEEMQKILEDLQKSVKHAEEEDEKIRGILETVADAIIILGQDGTITVFNPAAEKMYGYTKDEIIGKNIITLMPKEQAEARMKEVKSFDYKKHKLNVGFVRNVDGLRKNGSTFPLEAALSASMAGNEVFFTAVIRDITERKKNEKELINAKQAAENASKAKTEFMAVISHEIRTPMNIIIGMVDILKSDETDIEKAEKLQSIAEAAENLMNILNDIIDLSRMESGKMELDNDNFDLHEVISATSEFFSYAAREKGVNFEIYIDESVPEYVWGDKHRLRQVISNILGNAVKFTSEGLIKVCSKAIKEDKAWLLKVRIEDTGIGISSENIKKIFEQFTQADQSMSRKYGGSGLGLAICKKIVELMGGYIKAESTPGEGSIFSFAVRFKPAFGSEGTKHNKIEIMTDTPSVLIAEDSQDNRELISLYMKGSAVKITFAENGVKAVERFKEGDFHIILMDRSMPVMSGDQAAEEIRALQLEGAPYTPIFSFSANRPNEAHHAEGLYDGHFSKPFKKKDLEEFFRQIFPKLADKEDLRINIDPDFADLVPVYIERKTEDIEQLKQAAKTDDFEKIVFIAHSMKGTGRSYGFEVLTELGKKLETKAKNKDKSAIMPIISQLDEYLTKVRKTLM